jgi:hypothetical protein
LVSAKSYVVPSPGQLFVHDPVNGLPYYPAGHSVDLIQKLDEFKKVLLGHFDTHRYYTFVRVWLTK